MNADRELLENDSWDWLGYSHVRDDFRSGELIAGP
jgi:hypothetical protein